MAKVSLRHVYKVYDGGVRAVNDFNLEIEDKEFVVLVGPSGCGKSTTLRMIAGLENITAGQLLLNDEVMNDVEPKKRDIAMVFQSYALYPHLTVFQNMAFGLKIKKVDPEEIKRRTLAAAEILEITELLGRKPKELSGGQRQRVALGRAIVREPKVFLFDEPLSNLDAKLRVQMRSEITKLHKRLATTFIYVTHDQTEAMTMGERVVVMKDGYIQQVDNPVDLYENPLSKFVATFLGTPPMNILPCQYIAGEKEDTLLPWGEEGFAIKIPENIRIQILDEAAKERPLEMGIRPAQIELAEEGIPALIEVVEHLGDETLIYAKVGEHEETVIAKTDSSFLGQPGDTIHFRFPAEAIHLFDQETTLSILGMPRENEMAGQLDKDGFTFGENRFAFPEGYKKRILHSAFDLQGLRLTFPPKAAHIEEKENDVAIKIRVDLLMPHVDGFVCFATPLGEKKRIAFFLPMEHDLKVGQERLIYVDPEKFSIVSEEGKRYVSREEIFDNIVEAEFSQEDGKTKVSFGGANLLFDGQIGTPGTHHIKIREDKITPIFSRGQCKILGRKNPVIDPKRVIPSAAYDEDQLGGHNAVFLQIPGMEGYATFLVDEDISVYKAPKFKLMLDADSFVILD
ncbi:MAG: sn-glycerol-3-phosphate ABC transporter ATP-binding protein UgpC [Bacilli bacterium]|nr:sn-glycerol-3-phosphate ABC transporter ATP-binding protein UgpC [Bacilli bacterium]